MRQFRAFAAIGKAEMSRKCRWEKGILISGYGQFRNWLFDSKDRNTDLVDEFFRREGIQDQYWISISFPNDQFKNWEQSDIDNLEEKIIKDFAYDGYRAALELEHGSNMPRSVPLFWFLMLSAQDVSE
jgi:hypothetical protein